MIKKILNFFSVVFILLSASSQACLNDKGFLPENDLRIPVEFQGLVGGITEDEYHEVLDLVEKHYQSVLETHIDEFIIIRAWDRDRVNAYASQYYRKWTVTMLGGLARHHTITKDAFALVACHEIGHHIGGAPKKGTLWSTSEGQSDYFATTKCLRKIWGSDDNLQVISNVEVPETVLKECSDIYVDPSERALCMRMSLAGYTTAQLFRSLREIEAPISFDTPLDERRLFTFYDHPTPQCRLDTYFQGALCNISKDIDFSNDDEKVGACNSTDGYFKGVRPGCWYAPARKKRRIFPVVINNLCNKDAKVYLKYTDEEDNLITNKVLDLKANTYQNAGNFYNKKFSYYAIYDGQVLDVTKIPYIDVEIDTWGTLEGTVIPHVQELRCL